MYFPKFWRRGTGRADSVEVEVWGWSDSSEADAERNAASRATRVAQSIAGGDRGKGYLYGSNPLREPVLEQIKSPSGEMVGVVTRNGYGCEVLNTPSVLFCDIDLEDAPKEQSGGLLSSLFGRAATPPASPESRAVAKVRQWVQAHGDWGVEIYRTKAGLRLIATHDLFDPASGGADAFFEAVDADPHFRRLCKVQKSFRARLTPKPWRCGVTTPPARWPFGDAGESGAFEDWKRGYDAAAAGKSVCGRVEHIGSTRIHPGAEFVLGLHDRRTKVDSGLPLA